MKKIMIAIAVVAIVALATVNVTLSNSKTDKLSGLLLVNVEALAQNEGPGLVFDTKCERCKDGATGYEGVIFFCTDGSDSCYESRCVSGDCGYR
jgi:hypothetical protein